VRTTGSHQIAFCFSFGVRRFIAAFVFGCRECLCFSFGVRRFIAAFVFDTRRTQKTKAAMNRRTPKKKQKTG